MICSGDTCVNNTFITDCNQVAVKRVLGWKLKCQAIDRSVFFLLVSRMILDQYLFNNLHLPDCKSSVQCVLSLLKNKYFTNSFYLLNTNISSVDFTTTILLPSIRLLNELKNYHLPALNKCRDDVVSRSESDTVQGRRSPVPSSTLQFNSLADLVKWMEIQNPATEKDRLYFKKIAISNMLRLNPPRRAFTERRQNPASNEENRLKPSLYGIFQHALEERDFMKRKEEYEAKIKARELTETVVHNMREQLLKRRGDLIDYKSRFLQYLRLDQELAKAQMKLSRAFKAIPSEQKQEFDTLFQRYIQTCSSDKHQHIKDGVDDMTSSLASTLVKILAKYRINPTLTQLVLLSDPDWKFYSAVERFRKEMVVRNVHGECEMVRIQLLPVCRLITPACWKIGLC